VTGSGRSSGRRGITLQLKASYGGVIADRYERITVLVISSLASAVRHDGRPFI
jgi:hypothetical protein